MNTKIGLLIIGRKFVARWNSNTLLEDLVSKNYVHVHYVDIVDQKLKHLFDVNFR